MQSEFPKIKAGLNVPNEVQSSAVSKSTPSSSKQVTSIPCPAPGSKSRVIVLKTSSKLDKEALLKASIQAVQQLNQATSQVTADNVPFPVFHVQHSQQRSTVKSSESASSKQQTKDQTTRGTDCTNTSKQVQQAANRAVPIDVRPSERIIKIQISPKTFQESLKEKQISVQSTTNSEHASQLCPVTGDLSNNQQSAFRKLDSNVSVKLSDKDNSTTNQGNGDLSSKLTSDDLSKQHVILTTSKLGDSTKANQLHGDENESKSVSYLSNKTSIVESRIIPPHTEGSAKEYQCTQNMDLKSNFLNFTLNRIKESNSAWKKRKSKSVEKSNEDVEWYSKGLSNYVSKFISRDQKESLKDKSYNVILTTKVKNTGQVGYSSNLKNCGSCQCTVQEVVVPEEQTFYWDGIKYLHNVRDLLIGEDEVTGIKRDDKWFISITEITSRLDDSAIPWFRLFINSDKAETKPMPIDFRLFLQKRKGLSITRGFLLISVDSYLEFLVHLPFITQMEFDDTYDFGDLSHQKKPSVYKKLPGQQLLCMTCFGVIPLDDQTRYFTDIDVDDLDAPCPKTLVEQKFMLGSRERVMSNTPSSNKEMKIGMLELEKELFHSFWVNDTCYLSLNQLYVRKLISVDVALDCLAKLKSSPRRPPTVVESFLRDIKSSFVNTAWISTNALSQLLSTELTNRTEEVISISFLNSVTKGRYSSKVIATIYSVDDTESDTLCLHPTTGRVLKIQGQGSEYTVKDPTPPSKTTRPIPMDLIMDTSKNSAHSKETKVKITGVQSKVLNSSSDIQENNCTITDEQYNLSVIRTKTEQSGLVATATVQNTSQRPAGDATDTVTTQSLSEQPVKAKRRRLTKSNT